jgi:DNA-3-methyladenine glycosylase I
MEPIPATKIRCFGDDQNKILLARYHDEEWGIPVHNDLQHFEMLLLEGAQAGLSWDTVLKRREGYRQAFKEFVPKEVAKMRDDELEALRQDKEIIRNRLKIYSARKNAIAFLNIQQEFGTYDQYVWNFVCGKPIINTWKSFEEVPTTTPESDALAKDLKKRGMTFVGSTIVYAYMQAIGMVNDHLTSCWRYEKCCELMTK